MQKEFVYLDRYRNEGTRTYSKHSEYSECKAEFKPTSRQKDFNLITFEVPREHLLIYTANPHHEIRNTYLRDEGAVFCIHPQVLEEYSEDPYVVHLKKVGKPGPEIRVCPSSSTRTLYVEKGIFHALKVHFPFRVSRYGRKMRDEVIEQAINVSKDLEYGIETFDKSFAFLREVLGVAFTTLHPTDNRGENWGYLVRDMRPYPHTDNNVHLVPGFALYGKDFFSPATPPLLFDIIGDADPLEYIVKNIMLPIIGHWVQCYRSFGYMLEPHGQNVLLEVDDENNITRVVHRDLSLGIDMRRRQDLFISSYHLNNYNQMYNGEFSSITYDMFMGNHFFDRIIACCRQRYPAIHHDDFRAPCRALFDSIFPEHKEYIPAKVYYFSEKRDQYQKPGHQNTGKKPRWRP